MNSKDMNDTAYNDNNNDTTGGFLGQNNIGGLGYGIGISVGILLLITTITLASYFCTRSLQQHQSSRSWAHRDPISRIRNVMPMPPDNPDRRHVVLAVDDGLDEATIAGYPKLLYSEAKMLQGTVGSTTASCCSICLADYKDGDSLRLLPNCEHLFHPKCIDPWLRSHTSCPICRTSPLPTPLSTPLAEVMPLASRRS